MEVVLLWLDDLDDLVFAAALRAHRLRVLALGIGAAAAALLALDGVLALDVATVGADAWRAASAVGATAGVALWLVTGLFGERGQTAAERGQTAAERGQTAAQQ